MKSIFGLLGHLSTFHSPFSRVITGPGERRAAARFFHLSCSVKSEIPSLWILMERLFLAETPAASTALEVGCLLG